MSDDTVGTLLEVMANLLNDALRIMMFADKRAWGPDEFEQLRLLEDTLDEAKKDFQELPALVNGRFYYENDRKIETLRDLRTLCTRFELHSQTFKDWVRTGGPINATWARDTITLKRDLHRAQCRAARRIYNEAEQIDTVARCLGARQVYRVQQKQRRRNKHDHDPQELAAVNATGRFERLGDRDISFVCDFCDGYIVWEDLDQMPNVTTRPRPAGPTTRGEGLLPLELPRSNTYTGLLRTDTGMSGTLSSSTTGPSATATNSAPPDTDAAVTTEDWQATGRSISTGEAKGVVFAPVAIANHLPPEPGEWQSGLLCPYCDDYYYEEQGDDDMDRIRYNQDERGFDGVEALREHLEWHHASSLIAGALPSPSKCAVM